MWGLKRRSDLLSLRQELGVCVDVRQTLTHTNTQTHTVAAAPPADSNRRVPL